jgi:hypothetical protein
MLLSLVWPAKGLAGVLCGTTRDKFAAELWCVNEVVLRIAGLGLGAEAQLRAVGQVATLLVAVSC